ncbi:MAG: insulinase family protein [Nitrospirae bacterium]|nr:insulinase family protein [Nitrospirota bacterium]
MIPRRAWQCMLFTLPLIAGLPALAAPALAGPVRVETLDNGLTVVLKEEHKAPVVSFQVWYKVGSRDEVGGRTGLSHLLEHMMFKGTAAHGKGEYSRIVAKYGGTENAFTSRDYTAYYMNWAPQHLDLSVELEADRMVNLLVDPEEFNPERQVVAEERRLRIDDNPVYAAVEQLYAVAYLAHPYRQPTIGWMDDLVRLSRADAHAHYKRFYAPDNATVVVVGDFAADALLASIRATMGALPPSGVTRDPVTAEPEQMGERRITLEREAQLPFLILGYHVPNWRSPDADALVVLSQLLFEGKRSRIYERLIYTDQSAVDASGDYDPLATDDPFFYFHAMVAPGHDPAAVEAAIYEEVARLQTEPPSERELQRAKNQVEADFLFAQDSAYYQAMRLGEAVSVGAGVDYVDTFPERIRRVTADDVTRVARAYLLAAHRTVAWMNPTPSPTAQPAAQPADGEAGS